MLANYIIKNIKQNENTEEKSTEDENSPVKSDLIDTSTPKSTGKRLVSLINTKNLVNSKENSPNQRDKPKGIHPSRKTNSAVKKEVKSSRSNEHQIKGSNLSNKSSQEPIYEEEDEEGVDSSTTSNLSTNTFIPIDKPIQLTKCEDKECGCNATHCPFCETTYHKPSNPSKIRDHLESKHFSHAIQYEDFLILKCYKSCGDRGKPHFHCPLCKDVTLLKRTAFFRHLLSHAHKQGIKSTVIKVPDIKCPESISVNEYEIELCKDKCLKKDTKSPHYHCPVCGSLHVDRKSIISHVWRCDEKRDVKVEPADPSKAMVDKAYLPKDDVPRIQDKPGLKAHVSIVRSLHDLSHEKCQKADCCDKRIHCALCTTDRVKPTYQKKIRMHYYTHWSRRIKFKDYNVLPCYLDCQLKTKDITKIIAHFHCPICGGSRRRRECFIRHLEICQGEGRPVIRKQFDRSLREQSFMSGLKLEAVDTSIDDDMNDAMFDDYDDDDTDNKENNSIGIWEEEEEEVDIQKLKVFSRVTADISKQIVSELKSRGQEDFLKQVSSQTGIKYLVSPGTISPVHSFEGDIKSLTKAKRMVNEALGITDDEDKESCNGEHHKNTGKLSDEAEDVDLDDDDYDPGTTFDESLVKSNAKGKRGRKRGATKEQSDSVSTKKIKQEPLDNSYNSSVGTVLTPTPGKRYSTRGIKLNFAKLSAGGQREKTSPNPSSQISEGEKGHEIVLINEKKERSTLKVSKEMAKEIKERILAAEPKQGDKAVKSNKKKAVENLSEEEDFSDGQDDIGFDKSETFMGADGTPLTSACVEYLVKKYKLSTCAIIPKVSMRVNKRKNENESPAKKSFKVVNKYQCNFCDFVCQKFEDCTKHIYEEHTSDSVYRCDLCERHFDKPSGLSLHLATKHGPQLEAKEYKCDICSKVYMHPHVLESHIESKHKNPNRPKFSCRHCDFIGEDRTGLESHVRENHFKDGYICTICGKTFQYAATYRQHRDIIHLRKQEVKCPICTRAFANKLYLKFHMKVHTGEKKHACSICNLRFRRRGNMLAHEQTHMKKEDRSCRYICAHCGQKFTNKSGFLDHMNTHTGLRPYNCEICNKSFSFKSAVKKHKMYCHSDERPFQCSVCEKSFKTNLLMTQHMITHTGVSNYKCDTCNKAFTTSHTLKNHKPRCKGVLRFTNQLPGTNVIIYTSPPKISGLAARSLLPSGNLEENVTEKVQAQTQPQTSILLDTSLLNTPETDPQHDGPVPNVQGQVEVPTQEPAADVALYLCSECNAVFPDFASAEQHVLMGHESSATTNQTAQQLTQNESVMNAVNVILNEVSDSL